MILGSLRVPLLHEDIADETTSDPVDCSGFPFVTIYVSGTDDTISSGVIVIEEADMNPATLASEPYAGTWSPITTVTASDVTANKQKAIHLPPGDYGYVRTRISTAIGGGGAVSTVLRAS